MSVVTGRCDGVSFLPWPSSAALSSVSGLVTEQSCLLPNLLAVLVPSRHSEDRQDGSVEPTGQGCSSALDSQIRKPFLRKSFC